MIERKGGDYCFFCKKKKTTFEFREDYLDKKGFDYPDPEV
jgi:hypothetical protein